MDTTTIVTAGDCAGDHYHNMLVTAYPSKTQ